MIKSGAFLLKKHNVLLCITFFIIILCLAGCKSAPAGHSVDPLSLLDENKSFYFSIPKEADSDLFFNTIKNSVAGISDKDAKKLCGYLKHIYAGVDFYKRGKSVQASISSTIPRKYVPSILSKKNGWLSQVYTVSLTQNNYNEYFQNNINLSFPSDNIICLSDNKKSVDSMLESYDKIFTFPIDEPITDEFKIQDEVSFWLKGADNEIRFYSYKPQVLLTQFIGINLDLKLKTIKGAIIEEEDNSPFYTMSLIFDFQSPKYCKAGKALVLMTFGLNNSEAKMISDTSFEISGMTLNKQKLQKMLIP